MCVHATLSLFVMVVWRSEILPSVKLEACSCSSVLLFLRCLLIFFCYSRFVSYYMLHVIGEKEVFFYFVFFKQIPRFVVLSKEIIAGIKGQTRTKAHGDKILYQFLLGT